MKLPASWKIALAVLVMSLAPLKAEAAQEKAPTKPNFVIVFTDDQGYGDLGCYGSKTIATPRLDRMAHEGLRLTSFYVQPACGPSRAALMTGCYAARVIRSWRLASSEVTVAEMLKPAGYTTGCIGKWDLSGRAVVEGMLPNDQGFDSYFGTLGATDSGHVKFFRNKMPAGETSDMGSLTRRYTDEAIAFVKQNKDRPFFLYLAHSMPHVKIGASEQFRGKSKAGLYGDVIEEIDWNVGRLLDAIKELGLAENTLVLFTSDNGPWLIKGKMAGSAGPLRDGKCTTFEGGVRVPCIVWGPGLVKGGLESREIVASIDLLPTFARMAGARVPGDRVIDGCDQSGLLTGATNKGAREDFLYYSYDTAELMAVRHGRWKLFVRGPGGLYDLEADTGERHDLMADYPDVVGQLQARAAKAREDIGDGKQLGKNSRVNPADMKPSRPKGEKPKRDKTAFVTGGTSIMSSR